MQVALRATAKSYKGEWKPIGVQQGMEDCMR
jgi:hypothetical protein